MEVKKPYEFIKIALDTSSLENDSWSPEKGKLERKRTGLRVEKRKNKRKRKALSIFNFLVMLRIYLNHCNYPID